MTDDPQNDATGVSEEQDAALDTLAGGVLPLLGSLASAGVSYWVDSWTLDLVLLLGALGLAVGGGILAVRSGRRLVAFHSLAAALLAVLMLVSAPL